MGSITGVLKGASRSVDHSSFGATIFLGLGLRIWGVFST